MHLNSCKGLTGLNWMTEQLCILCTAMALTPADCKATVTKHLNSIVTNN